MNLVIRPELPGTERRLFAVGQVWTVDGESGVRWFVITPRRIIALFAGAGDHSPESLVHAYGDRLRLEQTATVYALAEGRHARGEAQRAMYTAVPCGIDGRPIS